MKFLLYNDDDYDEDNDDDDDDDDDQNSSLSQSFCHALYTPGKLSRIWWCYYIPCSNVELPLNAALSRITFSVVEANRWHVLGEHTTNVIGSDLVPLGNR